MIYLKKKNGMTCFNNKNLHEHKAKLHMHQQTLIDEKEKKKEERKSQYKKKNQ
jgi:hypothetical protein